MQTIAYVGNDINDKEVMKIFGTTYCPLDAHKSIQDTILIFANESCSLVYVEWENGNGMTENGERRPITGIKKIVTKIQKFEDLEAWKE